MLNENVKILLLGSSDSGKTSILNVYYNKSYSPYPTVGIEVSSKLIYRNGTRVERQPIRFFDMGGARFWWRWIPENLIYTDIVFVFYDVTSKKTFSEMNEIIDILHRDSHRFRIILVGNKTDKEQDRKINIFQVNKCIQKWRTKGVLLTHIETNIYNIVSFRKMLEKIILGVKSINTPKEFVETKFNISGYKKELSWGDYIFNWS